MSVIIDGKKIAGIIIEEIKQEVSQLPSRPAIAVVIVGENSASKIYVKRKSEAARKAGMDSVVIEMAENTSQKTLEQKIDELNNDENINAILVQMPLPKQINSFDIIQRIKPEKDVDGFHPENVGKLCVGLTPYAKSCTPSGIIELLRSYKIDVKGKNVVIIGRSNIVGKPLANMMLNLDATVTICHSKTQNIARISKEADILIAAVGSSKLVKADWIKQDAVVIDVGISRDENNNLTGDVDFEEVKEKASFITPVPGGVGPMTIAMLLKNTLDLYKIKLLSENQ
jgi:methylenetetrahydrofolate dehydrogenase (NADP+)/methenyltetrahydrofolate cyclohydrolase